MAIDPFSRHVPVKMLAIIDWEIATIGDPLLDFAALLLDSLETQEGVLQHDQNGNLYRCRRRCLVAAVRAVLKGRPVSFHD